MADAFDTAFADIMKSEGQEPNADFNKPVEGETLPPPVVTPTPTPTPVPATPEPVESELEVPVEGEGGDTGGEPPIPGAKPTVLDDAAVERLLAGLAARVPQQQAPQGGQGQHRPLPQPALVSPQETQELTQFYTDWPDVARAMEVMLRVTKVTTQQQVYAEMARALGPKLEMIDALATRAQLDYFERAVPNYETIAEQIGPWVEKQPDYLRGAYTAVMQNGTEDQVLDLIHRFQQATGQTQAQTPPAQRATPATELSPAAKQAAARLAPVRSARTTPTTQAAATDFDSAFAEALKAV
jgi:hypothetical protein